MATRTTLNVSLPVELGSFVEDLVARGEFASASEVVRTALRLLKNERERTSRQAATHPDNQ